MEWLVLGAGEGDVAGKEGSKTSIHIEGEHAGHDPRRHGQDIAGLIDLETPVRSIVQNVGQPRGHNAAWVESI